MNEEWMQRTNIYLMVFLGNTIWNTKSLWSQEEMFLKFLKSFLRTTTRGFAHFMEVNVSLNKELHLHIFENKKITFSKNYEF